MQEMTTINEVEWTTGVKQAAEKKLVQRLYLPVDQIWTEYKMIRLSLNTTEWHVNSNL